MHADSAILVYRNFCYLGHITLKREMRRNAAGPAGIQRFTLICLSRHEIEHGTHPWLISEKSVPQFIRILAARMGEFIEKRLDCKTIVRMAY